MALVHHLLRSRAGTLGARYFAAPKRSWPYLSGQTSPRMASWIGRWVAQGRAPGHHRQPIRFRVLADGVGISKDNQEARRSQHSLPRRRSRDSHKAAQGSLLFTEPACSILPAGSVLTI